MAIYEGAGVALITPFKANGEVNYDKLDVYKRQASRYPVVVSCSCPF